MEIKSTSKYCYALEDPFHPFDLESDYLNWPDHLNQ